MKNKEKYFDEILEAFVDGGAICKFKERHILKLKNCDKISCGECEKRTRKWLEREYKEPIVLSEDEINFLKILKNHTRYEWIIRKENEIVITHERPIRNECNGIRYWELCDVDDYHVIPYVKGLFKFITDDDEEPYSIEDLLNEN